MGHLFIGGLLSTELAACFPMGIKKGRPCELTVPLLAGELTSTGLRLLEDAWYPYWVLPAGGDWREPVLSLFLRAQVSDCCSSPSGALQRHTLRLLSTIRERASGAKRDLARRDPGACRDVSIHCWLT